VLYRPTQRKAREVCGLRTFKTKAFARFADREGLEDAAPCEAVRRARSGQIDADLGGGVIEQRVARTCGGRSGGFRTIVVFRLGSARIRVRSRGGRLTDSGRRAAMLR